MAVAMKTDPMEVRGTQLAAARQLARERGLSEEHVRAAVEKEMDRLSRAAAAKQFVVLLAIKHVASELPQRGESAAAGSPREVVAGNRSLLA
jgi:hypothetical protein